VKSASIAALAPFGSTSIGKSVRRAGVTVTPGLSPMSGAEGPAFQARWNAVGADYFTTMGQSVRSGRGFSALESGSRGAPVVAILDEVLARKLWPARDALGQRIQWAGREVEAAPRRAASLEIVGIVGATRSDFFEKELRGAVYVPFAQGFMSNVHFHLRPVVETEATAQALIEPVRRELSATAPGQPVFKVRTFRQHSRASAGLWSLRLGAPLCSVFGGLSGGRRDLRNPGIRGIAPHARDRSAHGPGGAARRDPCHDPP
jgi:hypothetical protein